MRLPWFVDAAHAISVFGLMVERGSQATEEAIINALVAAETIVGIDGHRVQAPPLDRVRNMGQFDRLATLPDVDAGADRHL